jgi:hypothetical protein
MAGSEPNLPVPYRADTPAEADFHVSELASEFAGSQVPWGEDVELPMPAERLHYVHPGPAERPNLAGI